MHYDGINSNHTHGKGSLTKTHCFPFSKTIAIFSVQPHCKLNVLTEKWMLFRLQESSTVQENKRRPASKQEKLVSRICDVPEYCRGFDCFEKQLIDCTFLKTMTFGDGNVNSFARFQKRSEPIRHLCSYTCMELTYKRFMWLFSPDVLGPLVSKTPNKVQSIVISPKSHQAVGVALSGRLRSLLSHRWAANYMRRKCRRPV